MTSWKDETRLILMAWRMLPCTNQSTIGFKSCFQFDLILFLIRETRRFSLNRDKLKIIRSLNLPDPYEFLKIWRRNTSTLPKKRESKVRFASFSRRVQMAFTRPSSTKRKPVNYESFLEQVSFVKHAHSDTALLNKDDTPKRCVGTIS